MGKTVEVKVKTQWVGGGGRVLAMAAPQVRRAAEKMGRSIGDRTPSRGRNVGPWVNHFTAPSGRPVSTVGGDPPWITSHDLLRGMGAR